MKLNIENVKNTVYRAYEKASCGDVPQDCSCKDLVDYVLDNTHLTYKYILVTALASKATDETVNPLCLQVKSELPGAYDARSICHGVIVRFDMEVLNKALGGSNEPFLNKPARFPELSTSNAVRKGRDQSILNKLCSGLPLVDTSAKAFDGLTYAIYKLLLVKAEKEKVTQFTINSGDSAAAQLMSCINTLLGQMMSNTVADIIESRVSEMCDGQMTADAIVGLGIDRIHSAGISMQKAEYMTLFAKKIKTEPQFLNELARKSNSEVVEELTSLRGIGKWTAKMYLLFVLNRTDILPYEDGAFLQSYRWLYQTQDTRPVSIKERCKVWKPYESIAARFMYRLLDYGYTKYASIDEVEQLFCKSKEK